MPATMLRASYTISAPTLQRFNAAFPAGERSRVVEQFMQKVLTARESDLENIAAAFMADPANAACLADEAAWDVAIGDGLEGV
jgi:hypothetical protein